VPVFFRSGVSAVSGVSIVSILVNNNNQAWRVQAKYMSLLKLPLLGQRFEGTDPHIRMTAITTAVKGPKMSSMADDHNDDDYDDNDDEQRGTGRMGKGCLKWGAQ